MSDLERRLFQANGRLKAGKSGISIVVLGQKLYLQGTFPAKPTSNKQSPHQQRLALGVNANASGISYAEGKAKEIGGLLACKQFSWEPWLKIIPKTTTVRDLITDFERDYFVRRQRTPQSQTTWDKDYLAVLVKLPQNLPLDEAQIMGLIASIPPEKARQRKRYCQALSAFARFAKLDLSVDLSRYAGSYSPTKTQERDLPSDLQIQQWFEQITNPEWRWYFGAVATYGLRPHEAWYLDLTDYPIARVLEGKTGSRLVWPCHPEWAEMFELANIATPKITAKNNTALGDAAGQYFRRNRMPFKLYDVRHTRARRCLEYGLDITLSAQQMGHSVQVHTTIYQRWIGADVHQRAFDALMNRTDRPRPPLA
jgi:hypothetical protein